MSEQLPIDPAVAAYLAQVPEQVRAPFEQLRAAIRAALPDADEVISYQIPTFRLHGCTVVHCGAFTAHCSLFALTTPLREQFAAELAPYAMSRGTIRFRVDQPIPTELVTRLVAARRAALEAG